MNLFKKIVQILFLPVTFIFLSALLLGGFFIGVVQAKNMNWPWQSWALMIDEAGDFW